MSRGVMVAGKRIALPSRRVIAIVAGALAMGVITFVAVRTGVFAPVLAFFSGREAAQVVETKTNESEIPTEVRLNDDKLQAANIQAQEVITRSVRETRTVPGSITYDSAHHLDLTTPVDCIVTKVLVEPGQRIKKGDQLAVLSSPEIGLARDEVLKREAELAIVRKERAWDEQISTNVEYLLELFTSHPAITDLEKALSQKPLGDYREKLLASYSRLLFSALVLANTNSLENKGTLSERLVQERRSASEVAKATFQSACETTRFDAARQRDRSRAAAEQAERLLRVSNERLASLMGPQGGIVTDGASSLSEFVVTSPFGGWVQERHVVAAARVTAGKPLFAIADTTSLWVSAEIHERDWRALDVTDKDEIRIRVPAMNNETFSTRLRFVGTQVAAETRSVPLVADLKNSEGRFRPGMFVWVDVPMEKERTALVVPPAAIMRHENQAFVFIAEDKNTFRRVDVKTGLETNDTVEILSGLTVGEKVVTHGSFFLKSELLLEREE